MSQGSWLEGGEAAPCGEGYEICCKSTNMSRAIQPSWALLARILSLPILTGRNISGKFLGTRDSPMSVTRLILLVMAIFVVLTVIRVIRGTPRK